MDCTDIILLRIDVIIAKVKKMATYTGADSYKYKKTSKYDTEGDGYLDGNDTTDGDKMQGHYR